MGKNARNESPGKIKRLETVANLLLRADFEGALKHCNAGLEQDPDNGDMQLCKLVALRALGRFDEATEFQRAEPKKMPFLLGKRKAGREIGSAGTDREKIADELACVADDLRIEGQHGEAIRYYDAMLAIDPKDAYAITEKALSLEKLGRFDEALKCNDTVLEYIPDCMVNIAGKVRCLLGQNKTRDADKLINAKLEENMDNPYVLAAIADVLHDVGRHAEAVKWYDTALAMDPDVDAIMGKIDSLEKLGRFGEAIRCLDQLLETEYDEYLVSERKRMLERMGGR